MSWLGYSLIFVAGTAFAQLHPEGDLSLLNSGSEPEFVFTYVKTQFGL